MVTTRGQTLSVVFTAKDYDPNHGLSGVLSEESNNPETAHATVTKDSILGKPIATYRKSAGVFGVQQRVGGSETRARVLIQS